MSIATASLALATQTFGQRGDQRQANLRRALCTQQAKCQYPSKSCDNLRAFKRDGNLHKFCEFHRAKANRNQRKHERTRKLHKYVELKPKTHRKTSRPSLEHGRPTVDVKNPSILSFSCGPDGPPTVSLWNSKGTWPPALPTHDVDQIRDVEEIKLESMDSCFDVTFLDEFHDQIALGSYELTDCCVDDLVGSVDDLLEPELMAIHC